MTDARNRFPLPAGYRGKQRARGGEQNSFYFPLPHFVQQIRIEHHGAAPRAAAALKFVLDDFVHDFAAIHVIIVQIDALFPCEVF